MAWPTLACQRVSAVFWPSAEPAFSHFNQVRYVDPDGVWQATFTCNPDGSSFLPTPSRDMLNSSEFMELWPLLLGIFVLGFCVKKLLEGFGK